MSKDLKVSVATMASVLQLTLSTIKRLEQSDLLTTADPGHGVKLNDSIIVKQIADTVLVKLGSK